jgi:hypothetical protein
MDLFLRHHIYSYYISAPCIEIHIIVSASNFIHTFVKWLAGSLKMTDIYHIYQIVAFKCNQAKVGRQWVPNGNLFSTQRTDGPKQTVPYERFHSGQGPWCSAVVTIDS